MRIFCTTILAWYLLIIAESFHTFSGTAGGQGRTQGPLPRPSRQFATLFRELEYETLSGIHLTDLTTDVRAIVKESGIREGTVSVLSRHTTCAITINEMEERLVDDARQFLLKLCPPGYPYLHNDLHLRSGPPDWPGETRSGGPRSR